MNSTVKSIGIVASFIPLAVVAYFIYISVSLGIADKHYTKRDLIDNYNDNAKEILEVRNYINSRVPANTSVEIEFEGKRSFPTFHVIRNGTYFSNWDVKANSAKSDFLLKELGWSNSTLDTLKEKLDNAHCISVESGVPCTIGYQRNGMGIYFYKIFAKPLSESLKKEYNDSCTFIYLRENIVLEYGGGAIGLQCFEDYSP